MPVVNRVAEFQDDMTAWRRHLHAHPELGFEEFATASYVAEKLSSFGVDEVHTGVGKTGVVAVVHGREGKGRIGLRADMDALPIHEKSGVAYASTTPGKMHACGHDGHTAMLLGAARYLAETRNFAGTVCFFFQPAEEGRAGARAMIEDGLFERFPVDEVYGLHNWPSMPVGTFGICSGPAMAASDEFRITLSGRGGHAAMPHLASDPVTTGAAIIQAVQNIVSREIDPVDRAVISITKFIAGDTFNVIPQEALLNGTIRTFRPETRDYCERRLGEVCKGIAAAMGQQCEVFYRRGYPPTINHEHQSVLAGDAAAEIVGEDRVDRQPPPAMGAEDFSYMLEKRPGSYIWMGSGDDSHRHSVHHPEYDFNDNAIAVGASYWVRLTERLLADRQGFS